jgi:hypothetical protein
LGGSLLDNLPGAVTTFNGTSSYYRMFDLDTVGDTYGRVLRTGIYSFSFWMNSATPGVGYPLTFRTASGYIILTGVGGTLSLVVLGGTTVDVTSFVPANAWNHLCFTQNGANLILYINNVVRATIAVDAFASFPLATTNTVGQYCFMGCDNQGGTTPTGAYWSGTMNTYRLWNRALKVAEVATAYADGHL